MSKLHGEILTVPKMSGSVSAHKSLSGNVGAKTINIGEDGATFIPSVSADGVISWTNDRELDNPAPVNIKGPKGEAGEAGQQGPAGADGISPVVSVEDIDGGHRVTITDKDGAKQFDVMDGKDGEGGEGGGGTGVGQVDSRSDGTGEIFNDYAENEASGTHSHAEGNSTKARGNCAHAEGVFTYADGHAAHAEGNSCEAMGKAAHAEGFGTEARGNCSHTQGKYNIVDFDEKYAHIVGNGTAYNELSNAHTLDWNGLGWFAGGLKVGGTGQDDPNAEEIPTKSKVQKMIDDIHWDGVKGKPFSKETVTVNEQLNIQWDGNTDGLLGTDYNFYKYSDDVFSDEDIKKITIAFGSIDPEGDRYSELFGYYWDTIVEMGAATEDFVLFHAEPWVAFIRKENTYIEFFGATFPEPGVYFFNNGVYRTLSLTSEEPIAQTKKVDRIDVISLPMDDIAAALGGGGGAQADWSVNDPDAAGYVKNRTHYEIPPAFDIQWDGDMTGKFALDMSMLGYPSGTYFVKVSDLVLTPEDVVGAKVAFSGYGSGVLTADDINTTMFPGAFVAGGRIVVVTEQSQLNATLGLPDGYITNGVYFYLYPAEGYVSLLVGPSQITKIPEKYLPDTVATKSYVKGYELYPDKIFLAADGDHWVNTQYITEDDGLDGFQRMMRSGITRADLSINGNTFSSVVFNLDEVVLESTYHSTRILCPETTYLETVAYLVCLRVQLPNSEYPGGEIRLFAKKLTF